MEIRRCVNVGVPFDNRSSETASGSWMQGRSGAVYVDGQQLVRNGEAVTIDVEEAATILNRGQARALVGVQARDWAKRTADEAFPLALEVRSSLN